MRQRTTSTKLTHRTSAYAARQHADTIHWLFRTNIPRQRNQSFGSNIQRRNFFGMGEILGVLANVRLLYLFLRIMLIRPLAGRDCSLSNRIKTTARGCSPWNQGKSRAVSAPYKAHIFPFTWLSSASRGGASHPACTTRGAIIYHSLRSELSGKSKYTLSNRVLLSFNGSFPDRAAARSPQQRPVSCFTLWPSHPRVCRYLKSVPKLKSADGAILRRGRQEDGGLWWIWKRGLDVQGEFYMAPLWLFSEAMDFNSMTVWMSKSG